MVSKVLTVVAVIVDLGEGVLFSQLSVLVGRYLLNLNWWINLVRVVNLSFVLCKRECPGMQLLSHAHQL